MPTCSRMRTLYPGRRNKNRLTRAAEFLFWLLVASVIGTIGGAYDRGLLTAGASVVLHYRGL